MQGAVAARLGYQGKYAGIELGPSRLVNFGYPSSDELVWLPSVELWAGKPEQAYVYLKGMTGSISPNLYTELGALGIGTSRKDLRASIELPLIAFSSIESGELGPFSPEVHGAFRLSSELWLDFELGMGSVVDYEPMSDRRFLVGISYTPQQLSGLGQ